MARTCKNKTEAERVTDVVASTAVMGFQRKVREMTEAEVAEWQRRHRDEEHRMSRNDVQSGMKWTAHLKGQIPAAGDYDLPDMETLSHVPRAPAAISTSATRFSEAQSDGPGPGSRTQSSVLTFVAHWNFN